MSSCVQNGVVGIYRNTNELHMKEEVNEEGLVAPLSNRVELRVI
jgi:hypothetical protein